MCTRVTVSECHSVLAHACVRVCVFIFLYVVCWVIKSLYNVFFIPNFKKIFETERLDHPPKKDCGV